MRDAFFLQWRDCFRWEQLPSIATSSQYGGKSQITSPYNELDLLHRENLAKRSFTRYLVHVKYDIHSKKCTHTLLKRSIIQDSHKTVGTQRDHTLMAVARLHPIFAAKILTDYIIRYRCVNEVITTYEIFIIAQFISS